MSRDKEVDNALAIFSRTGPSASASIVSHQLRDLFLGKISEEKSRTEEVIGLMDDLESQIDSLTAELRTEVGKNIVIRKALRENVRLTKQLKKEPILGGCIENPSVARKALRKALGDADICLWFG